MLIYQPSVLISSALRLPDLALSLSSFFILSHLSAQLFPLHVSLINTFQLLTLLSFATLFVSFGPSALSPSLLPLFSLYSSLHLCFSCLDIPTGLTFGMSTLTLICVYRHPL